MNSLLGRGLGIHYVIWHLPFTRPHLPTKNEKKPEKVVNIVKFQRRSRLHVLDQIMVQFLTHAHTRLLGRAWTKFCV